MFELIGLRGSIELRVEEFLGLETSRDLWAERPMGLGAQEFRV